MDRRGELIVISGFAGTGKGTLVKLLLERHQGYTLSISATTRSPRPGEVDGVHYFYKTREEFEAMIERDELLEYAQYVGNYYGTPKSFVEEQMSLGNNVILEIELQGALNIKKHFPNAVLLFVVPPSADELKRRLTGRGTETPEVIAKRLKRAHEESFGIENYDYLIVNDNIDECVEMTHNIVTAAHFSPARQKDFIERLQVELEVFEK